MLTSFSGIELPLIIRAVMAAFLSFFVVILFGRSVIGYLARHQHHGQPIRTDGPQTHLATKQGTPTMGGLLILGSAILSVCLFAPITQHFVFVCLLVLLAYGLTGFIDDYIKVSKETPNALTVKGKLFVQFMTAVLAVTIITAATPRATGTILYVPYFKAIFNLSWLYIPFAVIVISGASNGVNLSDGLDGLASGLLILAFSVFAVLAYVIGSPLAESIGLPYIPKSGEMAVVCTSIVGACLGFLWFNAPKAAVFMGDTGSLALGALLGTVSVILKQEILLAVVGGVFVAEALSVMIQVGWYKKTGKRFFRMAPIHHHFEQLGWPETTVVIRFWIVGLILAFLGLCCLMKI